MVSAAQQSLIQSSLVPAALGNDVAFSVQAKAMQAEKQQGAAMVALLDSAGADSGDIGPGDALVAKATGLGGLLDVTA